MFGSLFDEDKPVGVMQSVNSVSISKPPNRRKKCGLSGILNQGATCYLNSLLQTLLYTPEFREGLFCIPEEELGSLNNKDHAGKVRKIPLQLQRLFARLLLVDQQAASTTELTESFGWNNSETDNQHDVQELNRILFGAIESSLVGTSGKDLLTRLYHGTILKEIVCQNCQRISAKEEDFQDLNVIVSNLHNLSDSLSANFQRHEDMTGKEQYRCSVCCKLVDAKMFTKIQALPVILTFSIMRFTYDINRGDRVKHIGKFVFPFELDMAPFCKEPMTPEESVYELFSVVIHSGSSTSVGHYKAFIRDVDGLGKWYPPEEGTNGMAEETMDAIQDPICLLKAILAGAIDHGLSVNSLLEEINKFTGISWNKRFKSTHGVIVKFLQKHNEIFLYNSSTNMVYLREEISHAPEPHFPESSTSIQSDASEFSFMGSPKENKKHAVMNSFKFNLFDKKKPPCNPPTHSHNWFDFNDDVVSPIYTNAILKQYSGNESAYMLFYRRKSLKRPPEAKGNAKFMMPDSLLKLVDEENSELARQREEYDIAVNTVNLQVHLGNQYRCTNGVLEPMPNETSYLDLAIDRRKLLLDLRESVSNLCGDCYPSPNFVLHTAKKLDAGLHLYEELTEARNSETLTDLGILEGSLIFIWDGCQVGGEKISTGVAHEPILLNISIMANNEVIEFSRGFSTATTIGELKILINTLYDLPLEEIRFRRKEIQGEETRLSPLAENDDGSTLAELAFKNKDGIVADTVKGEKMQTSKDFSTILKICVQNHCYDMAVDEANMHTTTELIVDIDSTVENLKKLVMSNFDLDGSQNCVLTKVMRYKSQRLPLHENQTLREAGISMSSIISLEEGSPPSPEQIAIFFQVGIGNDLPDFEITVNRNMMVHECLNQMLMMAGLTGDNWHLCKTNWCGEPAEQLFLDGPTLAEEGVQHGEYLLVMEGRVPPKGFINFAIFLFPTLEKLYASQDQHTNGLHSNVENFIQSYSNQRDGIKIGDVELSNDSTVADLKEHILTFPALSNLPLPNIRYLRLRLMDQGRPGKILRGLSNTLKKAENSESQCVGCPNFVWGGRLNAIRAPSLCRP